MLDASEIIASNETHKEKKEQPNPPSMSYRRICSAIIWCMAYSQSGSVKPINPDRFRVCLFFK